MTEPIFVGVDPGKQGAIAILYPEGPALFDMPDTAQLATIFRNLTDHRRYDLYVAVEDQNSRPAQSSAATFTHAEGFGVIKGILAALQIPHEFVSPQAWKKQLRIPPGKGTTPIAKRKDSKAKSMAVAESMFPTACLRGPKGGPLDGRAEALLIATAIKQIHAGEKS